MTATSVFSDDRQVDVDTWVQRQLARPPVRRDPELARWALRQLFGAKPLIRIRDLAAAAAVASPSSEPALSRDAVGAAHVAAVGEATGAVSASTAVTSTRTGKPGRKTGGGGGPLPNT